MDELPLYWSDIQYKIIFKVSFSSRHDTILMEKDLQG
jgi:hypothetical protein